MSYYIKASQTDSTDVINGRRVQNIYLYLAELSSKPRDLSILLALMTLRTSLIFIPLLMMIVLMDLWVTMLLLTSNSGIKGFYRTRLRERKILVH